MMSSLCSPIQRELCLFSYILSEVHRWFGLKEKVMPKNLRIFNIDIQYIVYVDSVHICSNDYICISYIRNTTWLTDDIADEEGEICPGHIFMAFICFGDLDIIRQQDVDFTVQICLSSAS